MIENYEIYEDLDDLIRVNHDLSSLSCCKINNMPILCENGNREEERE